MRLLVRHAVATALWSSTPANGRNAKGTSEVAGIGMGSVIHQAAHSAVIIAVQMAAAGKLAAAAIAPATKATIGPRAMAVRRDTACCYHASPIPGLTGSQ